MLLLRGKTGWRKAASEQAAAQARADAERRAGFVSFAESEVQAGRLLPKDKNMCVAALETLSAASDAVSFGEGSQAARITPLEMCSWLQGQMSSCRAVIDFGDRAAGGAASFDARGKTDDEVHQPSRPRTRA